MNRVTLVTMSIIGVFSYGTYLIVKYLEATGEITIDGVVDSVAHHFITAVVVGAILMLLVLIPYLAYTFVDEVIFAPPESGD